MNVTRDVTLVRRVFRGQITKGVNEVDNNFGALRRDLTHRLGSSNSPSSKKWKSHRRSRNSCPGSADKMAGGSDYVLLADRTSGYSDRLHSQKEGSGSDW